MAIGLQLKPVGLTKQFKQMQLVTVPESYHALYQGSGTPQWNYMSHTLLETTVKQLCFICLMCTQVLPVSHYVI